MADEKAVTTKKVDVKDFIPKGKGWVGFGIGCVMSFASGFLAGKIKLPKKDK